jgi:hypothetical protein
VEPGDCIEYSAEAQNLCDPLAGQTVALSQWLMESGTVVVLLLALDGGIHFRNRAAHQVFSPDPAKSFGSSIWGYLAPSEAQQLRELRQIPAASTMAVCC